MSEPQIVEKYFDSSFAGAPKAVCGFGLQIDSNVLSISFTADGAAYYDESVTKASFHEGLWLFDCGELWLSSSKTGRYIEFNLSPSGAYWAQVFSEPRIRDLECPPPQILGVGSWIEEAHWTAAFQVSHAEIARCLGDGSEPNANVTIVLGGCPDQDVPLENLHTFWPLKEVDFHRPQDWKPISQIFAN